MHKDIQGFLLLLMMCFSTNAISEDKIFAPFENMLTMGNKALALSENLNEQRYVSMLQSADYGIDTSIVSLSNTLSTLQNEDLIKSIQQYLSRAKEHRIKYPSTALDTDVYQQSIIALKNIEVLPPEFSEQELQEQRENILKRLNTLKQRMNNE